jgi:hypothetical protein
MHPDNLDGSCYVHINDNATGVQDSNDSGGGISDSDRIVRVEFKGLSSDMTEDVSIGWKDRLVAVSK